MENFRKYLKESLNDAIMQIRQLMHDDKSSRRDIKVFKVLRGIDDRESREEALAYATAHGYTEPPTAASWYKANESRIDSVLDSIEHPDKDVINILIGLLYDEERPGAAASWYKANESRIDSVLDSIQHPFSFGAIRSDKDMIDVLIGLLYNEAYSEGY